MDPRAAEKTVVLVCRGLALAFAVTGLFFLFAGDSVVDLFDDIGDSIGSFSEGPDTDQKLWLSLGFAYMTVITGIALVVASDPARHRPFLLVLAAGKAASSLTSGAFFLDDDVFIYLANFLVDGSLVGVSLWAWSLAGRVERGSPAEPG